MGRTRGTGVALGVNVAVGVAVGVGVGEANCAQYLPPVFSMVLGMLAGQLRPSSWCRDSLPTPDDHFTAGPRCGVSPSGSGRASCGGSWSSYRCWDLTSRRCPKREKNGLNSAPDDHFAARPDCSVIVSRHGREGGGSCCPTVHVWVALSHRCLTTVGSSAATPDDISLPVQTAS